MIGDVQDDTKEQIDGFADVALQLSDRLGQVMKQQQALSFDSEKQNHAIQQIIRDMVSNCTLTF